MSKGTNKYHSYAHYSSDAWAQTKSILQYLPSRNHCREGGGTNHVLYWTEDWDGWPNGTFERDFTFEEFEKTGSLSVHWAVTVNGGDRKGDHQENSNRVAGLEPDQPDASRLSECEWRHNTLPMSQYFYVSYRVFQNSCPAENFGVLK